MVYAQLLVEGDRLPSLDRRSRSAQRCRSHMNRRLVDVVRISQQEFSGKSSYDEFLCGAARAGCLGIS